MSIIGIHDRDYQAYRNFTERARQAIIKTDSYSQFKGGGDREVRDRNQRTSRYIDALVTDREI